MPRYIVRRLLALIPVILGLTLVIFLLVNVKFCFFNCIQNTVCNVWIF